MLLITYNMLLGPKEKVLELNYKMTEKHKLTVGFDPSSFGLASKRTIHLTVKN